MYSKSVSVLKIGHSPKFRSLKCHTKILSKLLKLLAIWQKCNISYRQYSK